MNPLERDLDEVKKRKIREEGWLLVNFIPKLFEEREGEKIAAILERPLRKMYPDICVLVEFNEDGVINMFFAKEDKEEE